MTHEIAGVIATSLIIIIAIWIASLLWALHDIIKSKGSKKWIPIVIILPLLGSLLYYLYSKDGQKIKRKRLSDLIRNRWVVITIILIMLLSMYVRLVDYRWPYLRNIDSYVFYRWMDEIVQNNGLLPVLDTYELAPVGFYRPPHWIYPYFYTGAYSYMIAAAFVPIQLWEFLIYFPPFLAMLAVIPLYFIGKMLYDRKAGVLAAFFYAFDISNLSRSLGGDPDSDAIVILVSMIVMAAMIFTYKYASSVKALNKRLILYSVLTSVVLWVWYSTWAGYWYITWLFTTFIILKVLFTILTKRSVRLGWKDTKYIVISFFLYTALSFALTVPPYGEIKITSALAGPIQFQSIKGEDYQFPNVYVSVAELQQSGGPKEIIQRTSVLGGPFILVSSFFLMIYALIYLFYSYFRKRHHLDTFFLLLVWFVGPFLATIVAIRFSILFSAPLAIGSAIFLSKLIRMGTGEDKGFSD